MSETKRRKQYHWVRTSDHPAAGGRDMAMPGLPCWNVRFEDDQGRKWCIHLGRESRDAFIEMLDFRHVLNLESEQ